jgi:hypothetical protein
MMQTITIEWRHLDVAGKTCQRCSDTGAELMAAIAQLQAECGPRGVRIHFQETKLTGDEIAHSNTILINGTPLETILLGAQTSESCCTSCADLTGRPEQCRTLVHLGQEHETIPQDLIRQAVCRVGQCC